MKIVVIGGSGLIGSKLVSLLRRRGNEVVAASPQTGVNTLTGEGLAEVLAGAEVVVDVANSPSFVDRAVMDFFLTSGRNLLAAEKAAGVKHHVALSIVGIDGSTSGLYAGKLVQEDEVRHGGIPWTLLRSTQFHEFVPLAVKIGTVGPLVNVPKMFTQPVAAREVAEALVAAAEAGPKGRITDLGGPRTEQLAALVRAYLAKTGQRKRILEAVLPGAMGKAMRSGALVPAAGAAVGRQTFSEWLETRDADGGRNQ